MIKFDSQLKEVSLQTGGRRFGQQTLSAEFLGDSLDYLIRVRRAGSCVAVSLCTPSAESSREPSSPWRHQGVDLPEVCHWRAPQGEPLSLILCCTVFKTFVAKSFSQHVEEVVRSQTLLDTLTAIHSKLSTNLSSTKAPPFLKRRKYSSQNCCESTAVSTAGDPVLVADAIVLQEEVEWGLSHTQSPHTLVLAKLGELAKEEKGMVRNLKIVCCKLQLQIINQYSLLGGDTVLDSFSEMSKCKSHVIIYQAIQLNSLFFCKL